MSEHHGLLHPNELVTDRGAGDGGVLWGDEVGVHTISQLRTEGQHLGAERCDDPRDTVLAFGSEHGCGVHGGQILAHGGNGRGVVVTTHTFDEWLMTDTEAENESIVIGRVQGPRSVSRVNRITGPDVGDAGGDSDRGAAAQEQRRVGEGFATPGLGDPESRIPEGFELAGDLGAGTGREGFVGGGPNTHRPVKSREGVGKACGHRGILERFRHASATDNNGGMLLTALVISALVFVGALNATFPLRRTKLKVPSYLVGWITQELYWAAILLEAGLLYGVGSRQWPTTSAMFLPFVLLAAGTLLLNLLFCVNMNLMHARVGRAITSSVQMPLVMPRRRDDRHGSWWRTALMLSPHPRSMRLDKDVVYGPAERNRLDVWRGPQDLKDAPVLFFIHGGAWIVGDKREQGRPLLHELLQHGYVVVTCNYSLSPAAVWPAHIQDVTRALTWVKNTIEEYGGSPDRVVISGMSAGGQLASLAALLGNDTPWRPSDLPVDTDLRVRGCISHYGTLEMTGDDTVWRRHGHGLRELLSEQVMCVSPTEQPEVYRAASPTYAVHPTAPPFMVIQGSIDSLVDVNVARDFVDRFTHQAVAPIHYLELPLTQHATDLTASPRTSATTRACVAFAHAVTSAPATLPAEILAAYQVPPATLRVDDATGTVDVRVWAERHGGGFVLTAHNPNSVLTDPGVNFRREMQLRRQLDDLGLNYSLSTRVSSSDWPDERGVAITGIDVALARSLSEAWGQHAFYDVSPEAVVVRRSRDAAVIR